MAPTVESVACAAAAALALFALMAGITATLAASARARARTQMSRRSVAAARRARTETAGSQACTHRVLFLMHTVLHTNTPVVQASTPHPHVLEYIVQWPLTFSPPALFPGTWHFSR